MGIPIAEEIKHNERMKKHKAIQEELDRRAADVEYAYRQKLKEMSDDDLIKERDRVLTESCE